MNNIIEVKNLSKNIKGKTIIENMSFNIEKGDIYMGL
ncbi:ABC transporter, ATP-binding domain protein [Clostridium botulinum CDC_1436]|nr:ABC transporter, ATP-binding domain protein [Clostridium botulinum CDC_1436]